MTIGAKLVIVAILAGSVVAASSAASPRYVYRDVAFVTIVGHGSVWTAPQGIRCPKTCRWVFVRGTHLRFRAQAAPGWRFAGFTSKWCNTSRTSCVFDLVSPHDCIGGACPVGAFGVRARFVREA